LKELQQSRVSGGELSQLRSVHSRGRVHHRDAQPPGLIAAIRFFEETLVGG
jgi:hypothetical protein